MEMMKKERVSRERWQRRVVAEGEGCDRVAKEEVVPVGMLREADERLRRGNSS